MEERAALQPQTMDAESALGERRIVRRLRLEADLALVRGARKNPADRARPAFQQPADAACAFSERRLGLAAVGCDVGLEPLRRSIEHSRSAGCTPPPRAPPAPILGGRARSPHRSWRYISLNR